ncbi:hypothetical protein [Mycoplasmopsis edwardii]|uniref:Uncharacterized protein n=1 Tax=Mycoplasmopsis edwardii TaxID=53558 RepID=A0ACD4PHB6_9BACT|nr:hypothetical protein [Mycoplasmopsis edwardii]WBP84030.1 hypothetical protein Me_995_000664 [Mycoplasmopsis edwardii]
MNIFLDTSSSDFLLILFDHDFNIIDYTLIRKHKKKVDLIISEFKNILEKNNIKTIDINGFYTNLGPGYFTGVRSSLIYLRTIAMLQNQEFYTTNTFELVNIIKNDSNDFYLDAQGSKVYRLSYTDFTKGDYLNKVQIIDKENELIEYDFEKLIKNFFKTKSIFKKENNLINIQPFYIKKPQIGGK